MTNSPYWFRKVKNCINCILMIHFSLSEKIWFSGKTLDFLHWDNEFDPPSHQLKLPYFFYIFDHAKYSITLFFSQNNYCLCF